MALDRYGNSKDMMDVLADSTIDWFNGLFEEEIKQGKQECRLRRVKLYINKLNMLTIKDLLKILNEEISNEVNSTSIRYKAQFLNRIDESINCILGLIKINNIKSYYGGSVYCVNDKDCKYPIFKTEFSKERDHFGETQCKHPIVKPCVDLNIKIINL